MLLGLAWGCQDVGRSQQSGHIVWTVPSRSASTHPLVHGERVIFGTSDGAVIAFDRHTGAHVWKRVLAEGYAMRGERIYGAGGVAIAPHFQLWGLDPGSGQVLWNHGGPGGDAGTHDPSTSGDTVFSASRSGWVSAIDARSGEPYWSVDLAASAWAPAIAPDLVIYGTRGFMGEGERQGPLGAGHLIALNRFDGDEAWRLSLPDSAGYPLSGGAVSGGVVWQDRVIVGTSSSWVLAVALDTGELIWATPSGQDPGDSWYSSPPVVVDDVVVFSRVNRGIEGWDAEGGTRLWELDVDRNASLPSARDGLWYAFDGPVRIGDPAGTVLWEVGGRTSDFAGVSYLLGSVAADGLVYALKHGISTPGTVSVEALRPALRP